MGSQAQGTPTGLPGHKQAVGLRRLMVLQREPRGSQPGLGRFRYEQVRSPRSLLPRSLTVCPAF